MESEHGGESVSLSNRKITTYVDNIKDLPDRPGDAGITAAQLKAKFDGRTDAEVKASINGIVDDLKAAAGAGEIGAAAHGDITGASTVQAFMNAVADKRVVWKSDSAKYIRVNSDKVIETSADGTAWDKARGDTREYTATISAAWSGSAAPYTQTVTVSGITAEDMPEITPEYASVLATAQAQEKAWGQISYADTGVNAITFTCLRYKPAVAIPIKIRVVK